MRCQTWIVSNIWYIRIDLIPNACMNYEFSISHNFWDISSKRTTGWPACSSSLHARNELSLVLIWRQKFSQSYFMFFFWLDFNFGGFSMKTQIFTMIYLQFLCLYKDCPLLYCVVILSHYIYKLCSS